MKENTEKPKKLENTAATTALNSEDNNKYDGEGDDADQW